MKQPFNKVRGTRLTMSRLRCFCTLQNSFCCCY
uniref:Uncharacterized protein n=1 Tax=Anguilla anguilla TaxID=7936 RepID=A0A0E9QC68_ANGAN